MLLSKESLSSGLLQLIFLLSLVSAQCPLARSADALNDEAIRFSVETYCKADFVGIPDIRSSIAKFTAHRQREEKIKDPELMGKIIAFEADPIFIVHSYEITDIVIEKGKAVVTVVYDQIAKSIGTGLQERKIVAERLNQDVVKLQLIRDQDQWLILDPPIPRISIKAIIQFYKEKINSMDDWIDTNPASDSQRKNYEAMRETLKILQSFEQF